MNRIRRLLPLFVLLVIGIVLTTAVIHMPRFGDPWAPAHLHVAPRYIEKSREETGVPNMVSAILADYRGYDTLGELTVIFTAGVAVLSISIGKKHS